MSTAAQPFNWCSFDATTLPIDVAVDPTPPALASLLAAIDKVVMAVAVTPYVATGHLCWRHGYDAGNVSTSASKLYFSLSVAPGAVHGKFASTDRMIAGNLYLPPYHEVYTTTGGTAGANVARVPISPMAGIAGGNEPSFWAGTQFPVESSNTIDDTPAANVNRMLELPSFRHHVIEDAFCSRVMAWSCRVAHITSDLASL